MQGLCSAIANDIGVHSNFIIILDPKSVMVPFFRIEGMQVSNSSVY